MRRWRLQEIATSNALSAKWSSPGVTPGTGGATRPSRRSGVANRAGGDGTASTASSEQMHQGHASEVMEVV